MTQFLQSLDNYIVLKRWGFPPVLYMLNQSLSTLWNWRVELLYFTQSSGDLLIIIISAIHYRQLLSTKHLPRENCLQTFQEFGASTFSLHTTHLFLVCRMTRIIFIRFYNCEQFSIQHVIYGSVQYNVF